MSRAQQFHPAPISVRAVNWKYRLVDHRGRNFDLRLRDSSDRYLAASHSARRIARVVDFFRASPARGITVWFVAVVLLTEGSNSGVARSDRYQTVLFFGLAFGLPLLFAASVYLVSGTFWMPRVASAYLMSGICPVCHYSLAEIESDSDGCTICPECGAAWKLNALVSE